MPWSRWTPGSTHHRRAALILLFLAGRRRWRIIVCAALLAIAAPAQATAPIAQCPRYPPVSNIGGVIFYTDGLGSQVNAAAQRANVAKEKPVTDFLTALYESVDGAPSWSRIAPLSASCANLLLEQWAAADAIRSTNSADGSFSRAGAINRQALLRGFVFAALKLKARGQVLGPHVAPWLQRLVAANNEGWRRSQLRGNLYAWAGATAAVHYLLSGDTGSFAFQNEAWREALGLIREDGYLDAELQRGSRALIYHQYALSAILVMRAARGAMGLAATPEESARIRLLSDRVGASLCHPAAMAAAAHAPREEMPGAWGFREIAVYGSDLSNADWRACSPPVRDFLDVVNGGDQIKTSEMFHVLASMRARRPTSR